MLSDLKKDAVYSVELHFVRGGLPAASDITQQVFLKLMTAIGKFARRRNLWGTGRPNAGLKLSSRTLEPEAT